MSNADGSVEVAVKAEGVDDAAAELSDADPGATVAGGGGGGGGGDGGLRQALRGGLIGGLLSQAIGPLLDVLSPMLKILQAALAPLAALLIRLLSPVLRFLIQLLPAWMNFINNLPEYVQSAIDFIQSLPGRIWSVIKSGAAWLVNGAVAIGEAVWGFFDDGIGWLTNLPNELRKALSGLGVRLLEGIASGAENTLDSFAAFVDPRQGWRPTTKAPFEGDDRNEPLTREERRQIKIQLEGTIAQLITGIQADPNADVQP